MKRILLILAACACACAWAGVASARLGALGRNDMVVTNINIDGAIGAFAVTGAVKRAEIYGTPTRWTDATGCVWEASDIMGPWSVTAYPETEGLSIFNIRYEQSADSQAWGWMFDALTPSGHGSVDIFAGGNEESTNLEYVGNLGDPDAGIGWALYFARHIVPNGATNIIGRVAMTNDIPRTPGAVGAYPAASGSALESGKQDRLPYPTNAIPFSAIDGAPSLAGQTFDFSRNYDIIRATAAIAEAFGATITNNPTAQGGN